MNSYDSWGKGYDQWAEPSAFDNDSKSGLTQDLLLVGVAKLSRTQVLVCFGVVICLAALLFLFVLVASMTAFTEAMSQGVAS